MPPPRSYRAGASLLHWYGNTRSGCRTLQDFKKISILEVKGYCYGWHFYQAADADLVISSDDALFGHPAFRYVGYAPRMWQWAMMMGMRKFQEMVFTGRPFTAEQMYDCNFVNSVVPREDLEAESAKYAQACARTRPTDTVFMQKVFFEVMKQHQGEYMGSLLSAWLESMGGQLREDDNGGRATLSKETMDAGLNVAVKDNDDHVPARVAAESIGSPPPRSRLTCPHRRRRGALRGPLRRRSRGSGSSTSRRGSPAPIARSCWPTAARRSSRSSHLKAIRCAGGRLRAQRSQPKTTARSSTSWPPRSAASWSTSADADGLARSTQIFASADAVVWSRGLGRWRSSRVLHPRRNPARPPAPDRHVDHAVRARGPVERQAGHRVHAAGLVRRHRRAGPRATGAGARLRRRPDRGVARRDLRRHRHSGRPPARRVRRRAGRRVHARGAGDVPHLLPGDVQRPAGPADAPEAVRAHAWCRRRQ